MPKNHSPKAERDARIFDRWDATGATATAALGIPLDALKEAQLALQGHIVLPTDASYDTDRMLSNPIFNPTPAMIVYCVTEADVAVALGLARKYPVPFTVRSGGHCTAGFSGGNGLMIDISGLRHILPHVDPVQGHTVSVGAGCNFGLLNQVLEKLQLHVPGGECESVCIGGYVQGGGIGFTSATFGMNCDNVLEMRVMLADGSIVLATPSVNYDLFWAMRGGTGGNFGVLLSVTYRAYPVTHMAGIAYAWPLVTPTDFDQAAEVMMLLQSDYMGDRLKDTGLTLQMLLCWQNVVDPNGPRHDPPIPVFMVRAMYVGDLAAASAAMKPIHDMPGRVTQFEDYGRYWPMIQKLLDYPQEQPILPPGGAFEDKACRYVARDLTKAEWQGLLQFVCDKAPNTYTYMYLEFYGGAITAKPPLYNAFVHRDVHFDAVMDVYWTGPGDRAKNDAFLHDWVDLMEKYWNEGVYQNYCSVSVPDYARNYWGPALPSLVKIKAKYDPARVFTFAQEIPPTVTSPRADDHIPDDIQAALDGGIDYSGGVCAEG